MGNLDKSMNQKLNQNIDEKVVLVTGASAGLGKEFANRLLQGATSSLPRSVGRKEWRISKQRELMF